MANDDEPPQIPPAIPEEYTNQVWDGSLPAATGSVAKEFEKLETIAQTTLATNVYTFISNETADLTKLNSEDRLFALLVNLPQSGLIKIIYGLGLGTSEIGETSRNDNKLLALTGEGDSMVGCPQVLVFPKGLCTVLKDIKCPTDVMVQEALKTNTSSWHKFRINALTGDTHVADVMQCAPIPPFLVYDLFHSECEADVIYERILSVADQDNEMITHCRAFLRACMVNQNVGDPKPHPEATTFMTMSNVDARTWAMQKFKAILPSLVAPPTTPASTPALTEGTNLESLLRKLVQPGALTTPTVTENPKPEDGFGMSSTELATMLSMCGLNTGEEALLPLWFCRINEKGQNDNTRNQIIIQQLQNILFKDAEIPITAPLLQMIRKRKWLSDDPTATYRTAAKGLSIFAVGAMTEDEVAIINDTMEALDSATTTTAKEYKDVTRIKATVPEDSYEFTILLKTFANPLYSLFGSICPLYLQVRTLIRSFNTYTRTALKAMSMTTKASILWILLLQTRHFASGSFSTLAEFRNMMDRVTAKDGSISHAEVPAALIRTGETKKRKQDNIEGAPPSTPTRNPRDIPLPPPVTPSPERLTRVHPLLREKVINNVMRLNPSASLRKICTYSNTDLAKLSKDPSKCAL